MLVFKVAYPLLPNVNQSVCITLDWECWTANWTFTECWISIVRNFQHIIHKNLNINMPNLIANIFGMGKNCSAVYDWFLIASLTSFWDVTKAIIVMLLFIEKHKFKLKSLGSSTVVRKMQTVGLYCMCVRAVRSLHMVYSSQGPAESKSRLTL